MFSLGMNLRIIRCIGQCTYNRGFLRDTFRDIRNRPYHKGAYSLLPRWLDLILRINLYNICVLVCYFSFEKLLY